LPYPYPGFSRHERDTAPSEYQPSDPKPVRSPRKMKRR
jgi:hypothetical protein